MIGKWRESLDQGSAYGAVLIDLSKAFDCLPHELIIAKLYAYLIDMPSLKLIKSYLSKKRQRIKINVHNSWFETLSGYLRAPFLVHFYSKYLYVTFLCSYPKIVLLITLMIIPHTRQVTESTTLYLI